MSFVGVSLTPGDTAGSRPAVRTAPEGAYDRLLPLVLRPARYHVLRGRDDRSAAPRRVAVVSPRPPEILRRGDRLLAALAARSGLVPESAALPAPDLAALLRSREVPLAVHGPGPALREIPLWLVWLESLHDLAALVAIMRLARVEPLVAERDDGPAVVACGPASAYVELVERFADRALPGDPEVAVAPFLRRCVEAAGADAGRAGVRLARAARDDASAARGMVPLVRTVPSLPDPLPTLVETEPDALPFEVARGCALGEATCGTAGGHACPARHRALDRLADDAFTAIQTTGWERVSLVTESLDVPGALDDALAALEGRLLGRGVSLALAGARPAVATPRVLDVVGRTGTRQIALPPLLVASAPASADGGDGTGDGAAVVRPLRVREDADAVITMAEIAARAGIRTLRATFFVGAPGETGEDRRDAASLVRRLHAMARHTPHGLRLAVDLRPLAYEAFATWSAAEWPGSETLDDALRALAADVALRSVRVHAGSAAESANEGRLRLLGSAAEGVVLRAGTALSEREAPVIGEAPVYPAPLWTDAFAAATPAAPTSARRLLRTVVQEEDVRAARTNGHGSDCPSRDADLPSLAQFGRRKRRRGAAEQAALGFRVQYAKGPAVRFAAHLDVIRVLDRTLRRAGLPLAYTKGQSPRPRLSFGPPLAVGMTSVAEYFDVELREPPRAELVSLIDRSLPVGFTAVASAPIVGRVASLTASIDLAVYRVDCAAALAHPSETRRLSERVAEFRLASTWPARRRPGEEPVNVRPAVADIATDGDALILTLRLTHPAAVRPDVLAATLLDGDAVDPRLLATSREALLIALPTRRMTPLAAALLTGAPSRTAAYDEGWGPLNAS